MNLVVLALLIITSFSLSCMEDPHFASTKPSTQLQQNDHLSSSQEEILTLAAEVPETITIYISKDYSIDIPRSQAQLITAITSQSDLGPESEIVSLETIFSTLKKPALLHPRITLRNALSFITRRISISFNNAAILRNKSVKKSSFVKNNFLIPEKSYGIFKRLLEFDLNYCIDLNHEEVNDLFKLADVLGFKHETLRKLTLLAKKKLPLAQQSLEIRHGLYLNSITSLINRGILHSENHWNIIKSADNDNSPFNILDLSNLNLDNLDGFERLLTFITVPIHKLVLDNNNINRLDITTILRLLPQLTALSAQHCTISLLHCPSNLPDRFNLFLNNSIILNCSSFKMGEDAQLDITDAIITQQTQKLLHKAINPPFNKRYRHHLRTLSDCIDEDLRSEIPVLAVFPIFAAMFFLMHSVNLRESDPFYYYITGASIFIGLPLSKSLSYYFNYQNNLIHKYRNSILIDKSIS